MTAEELMGRLLSRVAAVLSGLGQMAVLGMLVLIACDVLGGNLLGISVPGTTEIVSVYLMVAIAFLPIAKVERDNRHIAVDLLVQFFSAPVRLRILAVSCLISAVFLSLVAYAGWEIAMKKMAIGEYAFGARFLLIWPARFIVPLGTGAMALFLFFKAWRLMRGDASLAPASGEQGSEAPGHE